MTKLAFSGPKGCVKSSKRTTESPDVPVKRVRDRRAQETDVMPLVVVAVVIGLLLEPFFLLLVGVDTEGPSKDGYSDTSDRLSRECTAVVPLAYPVAK